MNADEVKKPADLLDHALTLPIGGGIGVHLSGAAASERLFKQLMNAKAYANRKQAAAHDKLVEANPEAISACPDPHPWTGVRVTLRSPILITITHTGTDLGIVAISEEEQ